MKERKEKEKRGGEERQVCLLFVAYGFGCFKSKECVREKWKMSVWEKITMVGVGREVKRGKKKGIGEKTYACIVST